MPRPPETVTWIKYHPGAALFELYRVSPLAELAHRRFCDYHWQTGLWPNVANNDASALARVSPKRWPALLIERPRLGWREHRGRVQNPGVHRVRADAVAAVKLARHTGHEGAKRRWTETDAPENSSRPDGPPNRPPIGPPQGSPMGGPMGSPIGPPMQIDGKTSKSSDLPEKAVITAERSTRTASPLEKGARAEKSFLGDVAEAFKLVSPKAAKSELDNWGGWWRKRFRESPGKAQRVLAEITAMVRERRVLVDPGRAAVDLWKRLP